MSKIRVGSWVSAIAVMFAAVFAFSLPGCSDKQVVSQPASLRLAWLPGATFTGDYVAKEKGYWKEQGLDVTLNPGGFEFDAIKLVAAGVDTFGISSGPQLLQARANGVPIVAIAAVIPRSPIGWVAKTDSGIKKPQDFVGKKIGAQFGTHTEITLEALCAKLGIALTSFQRIPVKFDPRPFVSGDVDVLPVYLIDQPVDLESQGLALNKIDPGDYGVSLAFGNVYFTSEDVIKKHPELVRQFLLGAKKGWGWSFSNRPDAIDVLVRAIPDANKKVLLGKLNSTFDFIQRGNTGYPGVFSMKLVEWESTRDILIKYGDLSKSVEVNRIFTNDFLPK